MTGPEVLMSPEQEANPSAPPIRASIVIPTLNEQATLCRVVERVLATGCAHELIVVDDGSTDDTPAIVRDVQRRYPETVHLLRHAHPRGKGAAVRAALAKATGDVVVVQDADLEYDPADIPSLLASFANPEIQAVFGSRNLQPNPRSGFWFYWGGRGLSMVTNLLFGSSVTDESTGYKVVRTPLMRELALTADGFDFCPELTGRLLKRGIRIHEVPISYRPRSFAEGKKIRWRDGLRAVWVLVRERWRRLDR